MPSSEKRLIKQLVDNYENAGKIGRPVKNMKETITVGYGLTLFQLLDLDEKNQVLTTNVWAKYTWIDQLLRWDPSNYTDIQEVRIPPRLIWTPDIVLYNFNDERLQELRDVMLNVDFTGQIFWSPPAIFKSNCHIDIRNFPFDNQYCFLKFASWTHDSEQLDLQFFDNVTEVDVGQYTENNEWILIARPARRFVMMSENCGKKIPDLTFFLFIVGKWDYGNSTTEKKEEGGRISVVIEVGFTELAKKSRILRVPLGFPVHSAKPIDNRGFLASATCSSQNPTE
ncbi:unnamed protein product [Calicophoron daubneyi]|uniref:Neurotransmitter-gated ion-channel ligand-binding domain-containing protein n=1 Tax=Calicophoron daubneyi TaxID=300641 RepID=A0AAV2U0M1_CALDB